ncbi:MAG: type IX secretion system sortase PorU [Prolixibacteraceae bacterium]|nr:type IX secretion system sortase PorU [Prolixibacteraceae bacterium]MBN2649459.1 type IX secretion system sortase PorU [Prolixibacteraceae bacterium]
MKQFSLIIALILGYTINISAANLSQNSVLATGKWIKVATTKEGIHKVTYQNLNSWGISNPSNVAVFTNGGYLLPEHNNIPYPDDLTKIQVVHGKDHNNNDCIFFYSTGIVKWTYNENTSLFEHTRNLYSDYTYFFITSDNQKSDAPLVKEIYSQLADTTLLTYNGYKLYEKELSNIYKSGRIWFGDDVLSPYGLNINFSFDDIADNIATMMLSATAASDVTSEFQISLNDQRLPGTMQFPAKSQENAVPVIFSKTITASSSMDFRLDYFSNEASGKAWIDYLTINRNLKLKFNSEQLSFRNSDARKYDWVEFVVNSDNNNLILLDVTDPLDACEIEYVADLNALRFTDEGGDIKNYVIFDPKSNVLPDVSFIENVENQNIHGEPDYDMIIVSHPDFVSASERLADFHYQNDGLKVLVLETPKIFNEFSSGAKDASGIRNMIRYFYRKAEANGNELKYVLLMGDGSFDNKGIDQSTNSNYIPTYQSGVSSDGSSITSDDFYALLDEEEGALLGKIDIGIGRIPCENINEANLVVDKIIKYASPETFGNWRNIISFWSDDEDNNIHMSQTEQLVSIVENNFTGFYIDKIYFDSFKQVSSSDGDAYPEVNKRINQQVNDGALILNYVGHASTIAAAAERVLTLSDISSWSNQDKLPVFVTATCEFSRFDDVKKSAGEEILFHPAGGGVALFSTTRIVYSHRNFTLSSNFYANAFKKDEEGKNLRMGDIMKLAKNATNDNGNRRSFALLGDPALRLAFPTYKVNTKSINGQAVDEPVQVGAMDKVRIEGEVSNHNNEVYTNYNGTVDVTVYDKNLKTKTLANDGGNPYEYEIQNNIIYKGKATVKNGTFEFSFVVPKDISYSIGNGNIYYYTYNEQVDGHGSCDKIVIGGSGSNPVIDNTPPDVQLYINNENFKNYDKIASNALLIARIYDESGINTVGTGIGHDATAVLNDDFTSQIVLNDYYEADTNSYQKGTIVYPLNGLEPGEHKLSVKIWDVQNQSSTAEIHFIVDDEFKITHVSNYPNPVQFDTNFYIEHNLPGHVFDAQLDIFNLAGQQVHQSMQKISSNNTVENTIEWDISQSTTHIPRRAILVYRILLQNSEGQKANGTGKMIINY